MTIIRIKEPASRESGHLGVRTQFLHLMQPDQQRVTSFFFGNCIIVDLKPGLESSYGVDPYGLVSHGRASFFIHVELPLLVMCYMLLFAFSS